ncbi:MAG: energy transducer TonB [Cyclobacteriaceae bacterium]|nr:energy transducer TonB [Cyclobacteriaceae bacterium]
MALKILSDAPKWNPGKQNGKAVKQKIVLPISFQLI